MSLTKSSDDTVKLKPPVPIRESLGEWCVRQQLATPEEIDACLRIQRSAEVEGKAVPRLGEILVDQGILTQHQVAEGLASQHQEIRSCPHCGIQINVSTREDAAAYRCGRCQGLLEAPAVPPPLQAVEEDFILVSKDPVPAEVEAARQDPESRFGKYVLLRKLGQGGIGIVYLAWDTFLSQYVALKRLRSARPLRPQDTPAEHVQSLLKEARNCIRLRHPGVVSVYDVGRVGREYYVAMEYLEGETLYEKIQAARREGLPSPFYRNPRATLEQLIEIARALSYAHGRPSPIIHCDLKPANILIDPDAHAHVLDFGLARNLELDKPLEGEISGTPSYMAPEQASGESYKIDRRTDVYAFGALLYELLTGRPPFTGGTVEILGKTIGEEPDRPSDFLRSLREKEAKAAPSEGAAPSVPPALEDLCLRCLRKDRADRPQSMEEVAGALQESFFLKAPAPKSVAAVPGRSSVDPSVAGGVPASVPAMLSRSVSPSGTAQGAPSLSAFFTPPVSAPIASSHPSPERPGRSRQASSVATWVAVVLVTLAAGGALVFSLGKVPAGTGTLELREAEILSLVQHFHPAQAAALAGRLRGEVRGGLQESRVSLLAEEASWVAQLQGHVVDCLKRAPVVTHRPGSVRPEDSRLLLLGADDQELEIRRDGREESLPWDSLGTRYLLEILVAALGEPTEADLLGLGILALRGGLRDQATLYFSRLRKTSLGPIAERYLASMND